MGCQMSDKNEVWGYNKAEKRTKDLQCYYTYFSVATTVKLRFISRLLCGPGDGMPGLSRLSVGPAGRNQVPDVVPLPQRNSLSAANIQLWLVVSILAHTCTPGFFWTSEITQGRKSQALKKLKQIFQNNSRYCSKNSQIRQLPPGIIA